jgi:acetate kinase
VYRLEVHILVVNSGSSSIKFSVFDETPSVLLDGEISGVDSQKVDPAELLEKELRKQGSISVDCVGYRVVHPGPKLNAHQRITDAVLAELEAAVAFAPLHDPEAIALIRAMETRFPAARHYACFDTVFHQTMPAAASTYAIAASYRDQGVRRYGFHGLSCESIVESMGRATGSFPRRAVIAHLGSGCSVSALIDGKSVDTTMGLTPTGGVVMGTRPGDLDPGLVLYLVRQGDVAGVETMLNHKAGMVALSGLPNDMRAVRAAKTAETRLALEIFTRSVRKAIGSFAWLLGGLDAVIFTGGIGEHDAASRTEILSGLESSGVVIDEGANQAGGEGPRLISTSQSQIGVWVAPAEEDRMIAVHVKHMDMEEA